MNMLSKVSLFTAILSSLVLSSNISNAYVVYRYKADGVILDKATREIVRNNEPSISTFSLPDGSFNVSYSYTLNGSDEDNDDLTWSWSGYPNGLNLNSSTGEITGNPLDAGNHNITIQLSDGESIKSKIFSINIANSSPDITTSALSSAGGGVAYSFTVAANDTDPGDTLTWSWSGDIPSGLNLNASTGEISGTTSEFGSHIVTIEVSDYNNATDSQSFTLDVEEYCAVGPVGSVCDDGAIYIGNYSSKRLYSWPNAHGTKAWQTAINSCNNINGGIDGWFLPNYNTLKDNLAKARNAGSNIATDSAFWSSTTNPSSASKANTFRIQGSFTWSYSKTSNLSYICFRN